MLCRNSHSSTPTRPISSFLTSSTRSVTILTQVSVESSTLPLRLNKRRAPLPLREKYLVVTDYPFNLWMGCRCIRVPSIDSRYNFLLPRELYLPVSRADNNESRWVHLLLASKFGIPLVNCIAHLVGLMSIDLGKYTHLQEITLACSPLIVSSS